MAGATVRLGGRVRERIPLVRRRQNGAENERDEYAA